MYYIGPRIVNECKVDHGSLCFYEMEQLRFLNLFRYIFLAVALDPKESLCEYSTMFAVSLPDEAETNTLITFSIFLLLLILCKKRFYERDKL